MIEAILLSYMLGLTHKEDQHCLPKEDKVEIYYSKEGTLQEEDFVPKLYKSKYFKKV